MRHQMSTVTIAIVTFIGAATLTGPARAQNAGHEGVKDPGLRTILADLAAGRQVSARVSLPLQIGYFDNQTALYITPEVGVDPSAGASTVATARQIAVGFNANFIPTNFASLPGSPAVDDIFVLTNFAQGNVLASAPQPAGPTNSDKNYSPLWQVNLVTWDPTATRRALTSQADILTAEQQGLVTIQKTPIIVECSVMFTPRGGLLPDAKIGVQPARSDRDREGGTASPPAPQS